MSADAAGAPGAVDADADAVGAVDPLAARIVASLTTSRSTIAVAESLTGGLLTSALVSVPGASAVLAGGLVAYDTELKRSLLGVDAQVLAAHGPVHPDVAMEMAAGVRTTLAVRGEPARIGLSTTGVAGPDPQGGQPPGTVFVGLAVDDEVQSFALALHGDRTAIRAQTVARALEILASALGVPVGLEAGE
jgi:nicotinamide-nucleotide amidase